MQAKAREGQSAGRCGCQHFHRACRQRRQRRDDRRHAAAGRGGEGGMLRIDGAHQRAADPGGEAAALVRLARTPIDSLDDHFDLLLAIDWQNVNRFADEIPLTAASVLVGDPDEGEAPEAFRNTGARYFPAAFKKTAKGITGSWTNMVALGLAGALAGLSRDALHDAVRESWKRGADALAANLAAVDAGIAAADGIDGMPALPATAAPASGRRWLISGNEAAGFGAIRGGVRFVADVPDHAGHRAPRMDGAGPDQGRRLAAAGRG